VNLCRATVAGAAAARHQPDANQFSRIVIVGSDVVLEDRGAHPWKVEGLPGL
jgi:hypothetical protein